MRREAGRKGLGLVENVVPTATLAGKVDKSSQNYKELGGVVGRKKVMNKITGKFMSESEQEGMN